MKSTMAVFRSFAILPAAGRSARMGAHKLLLPWQRRTIIDHVLDAWTASSVTRTVIVVRAEDSRLVELCQRGGVDVVLPDWAPAEMKISVQLALRHIEKEYAPRESDAWLLAPADMPRLTAQNIDHVLRAHDPLHPRFIVPVHLGRRGHPALFTWSAAQDVYQLGQHEGVNAILAGRDVGEVECDSDAILQDIDTPEDFTRLEGGP